MDRPFYCELISENQILFRDLDPKISASEFKKKKILLQIIQQPDLQETFGFQL